MTSLARSNGNKAVTTNPSRIGETAKRKMKTRTTTTDGRLKKVKMGQVWTQTRVALAIAILPRGSTITLPADKGDEATGAGDLQVEEEAPPPAYEDVMAGAAGADADAIADNNANDGDGDANDGDGDANDNADDGEDDEGDADAIADNNANDGDGDANANDNDIGGILCA